jgi:hypothetical protein
MSAGQIVSAAAIGDAISRTMDHLLQSEQQDRLAMQSSRRARIASQTAQLRKKADALQQLAHQRYDQKRSAYETVYYPGLLNPFPDPSGHQRNKKMFVLSRRDDDKQVQGMNGDDFARFVTDNIADPEIASKYLTELNLEDSMGMRLQAEYQPLEANDPEVQEMDKESLEAAMHDLTSAQSLSTMPHRVIQEDGLIQTGIRNEAAWARLNLARFVDTKEHATSTSNQIRDNVKRAYRFLFKSAKRTEPLHCLAQFIQAHAFSDGLSTLMLPIETEMVNEDLFDTYITSQRTSIIQALGATERTLTALFLGSYTNLCCISLFNPSIPIAAPNNMFSGKQETGKSWTLNMIKLLMPPGMVLDMSYMTQGALGSGKANCYGAFNQHEAHPSMCARCVSLL